MRGQFFFIMGACLNHYIMSIYNNLVQSIMVMKGEIPMRDLVYRVLDLPSSMKALVYDFGRLSVATEREYIHQIVKNRVSL